MIRVTETPFEHDVQAAELLADTTLVYFETSKSPVLPFEKYRLKWKVNAPQGVFLQLNGAEHLPLTGSREITGLQTAYYRLTARVRQLSKYLGTVSVAVDTASCEMIADPGLNQFDIEYWIKAGLALHNNNSEEDDKLYIRENVYNNNGNIIHVPLKPTYRIEGTNARVKMFLTQKPDWEPNPDIDISLTFGIGVRYKQNRYRLAPVNPGVQVDLDVAWYVDVLAEFSNHIANRIKRGRIAAYNAGLNMIGDLVDQIDLKYVGPNQPMNKTLHGAAFREADQSLLLTFCKNVNLEVEDIGGNAGVENAVM